MDIRRAAIAVAAACIAVLASPTLASAAPTPPSAPTITAAAAVLHGASLQFDPPADDGGSSNLSYTAECTSGDGGIANGAPGTFSPIVVTGLTDGAMYTCTVTASNESGPGPDSAPSDPVVPLAIAAPSAPSIGTVAPGDTTVDVTVNPPADDGGAPIVLYKVGCTSSDGGVANSQSGIAMPITVTGLTNTRTYTCSATASNSQGTSPTSPDSPPFTLGPPPPPAPSGSITGTVTATPPADLSTYCAQATTAGTSSMVANTPIAADGTYTISGIAPGSYDVRFVDCTGGGDYLPQWFAGGLVTPRDDPVRDGATPVDVFDGVITPGIDGHLTRGAHVRGTVTAAVGGAPLEHICVVTLDNDPNAITQTAADGTYELLAPQGSWLVGFFDCSNSHYVTAFWDHTIRASNAVKVTIAIGTPTTGIDAALVQGGTLSGTVTETGAGNPIENVCVSASGNEASNSSRTDSNGDYSIDSLPAGTYEVSFVDCGQPPSHAGVVRGGVGVTVAGPNTLDVTLTTGAPGSISGKLTTSSGSPLRGVCAAALVGGGDARFSGPTGADGTYRFDGLGPGRYFVGFFGCDQNDPLQPIVDPDHPGTTYTPQWFSNAPLSSNPDPFADGATPVQVFASSVTTVDNCFDACNRTITITGLTPGDSQITVAFTVATNGQSVGALGADAAEVGTAGALAAAKYTATCTSANGGAAGHATGDGSPLVVTGLTNGRTYTCTVTSADGRALYSSAVSAAVVAGSIAAAAAPVGSGGSAAAVLAFTGSNLLGPLTLAALVLLVAGGVAVLARRRRAPRGL